MAARGPRSTGRNYLRIGEEKAANALQGYQITEEKVRISTLRHVARLGSDARLVFLYKNMKRPTVSPVSPWLLRATVVLLERSELGA